MYDLNEKQVEAVITVEGPLLVLAGAGSGKTRVITYRVAHLIDKVGVRPDQVLAVTFTNKAAGEMKGRIEKLLRSASRAGAPLISTFHSFCVRVLRRNIEQLKDGYTRNFTIYDDDDQIRLVKNLMKELDVDDRQMNPRQVLSSISWAKNHGQTPAAYAQGEHQSDRREKIAKVYKHYKERLQTANALDFDDLLLKAVELLKKVPQVRDYYHQRFRHMLIDEFQDTNGVQYELARLVSTGTSKAERVSPATLWRERSLCVVGDIDQSVYSFRGSDFNIILGFQNDFEGTKIIKLEQNYRSTETILEAANHVIENNHQRFAKTLYATKELGRGEKIRYFQAYDGESEAAFVAERVSDHLRGAPDRRCAVLYRTNAQSRLFEEAMRRRSLPYNIVGGFSFYERAEVKDIIAYLKLALNPDDDMAMLRVINSPPRGIGKATLEILTSKQRDLGVSLWRTTAIALENRTLFPRALTAIAGFRQIVADLSELVKTDQGLADVARAATTDTGYVKWLQEEKTEEAEGRLLNIEELVSAAVEAEEQGETLRDFIDHAALVSDTDQYREDARITLLTMHSAKGLEFPVVFIVGLEEGLFPHSRAAASEADLEEERRLCYVAITRAQQHLYLTHAIQRRTFGEELPTDPSRFLNEVPLSLIDNVSPGPSWLGFAEGLEGRPETEATTSFQGKASAVKRTSNYTGRTYNSVESVNEFLKNRKRARQTSDRAVAKGPSWTARQGDQNGSDRVSSPGELRVGSRVRHERYGTGIILRAEGSGENAKLTVNFPGFGQKKFIAKFAQLERV
jgi:DNA helicase-2/ATP-dependent DNA helicase PcrA